MEDVPTRVLSNEAGRRNACEVFGSSERLVALTLESLEVLILCPVCLETIGAILKIAAESPIHETPA